MIPLIIIYVLFAVAMLLTAYNHGKPRTGKHNFWIESIMISLQLVLIWWALGWRIA